MTVTPFPQLLFYIGMTLNFTMMLAVASVFVFRRRQQGWQRLPVVSFAWPLVPGLFVIAGAWMTIYGITLQSRVSFFALGTVVLGALVYHFRIRQSAAAEPA
jgi:APA family basic amino acid/polyamine antiporter